MTPVSTPPIESASHRLLVIAAHCDDETFGCGGTIALEASSGSQVTIFCLTGTQQRLTELQAAAKILKAAVLVNKTKDFSLSIQSVVDLIIPIIQKTRPEVILTHSPVDYHPDHQIVHHATLQAAEWAGHATLDKSKAWRPQRILCFEINNLISQPTCFIDISEVIEVKRLAILTYKSQLKKSDGFYMAFNMQKAMLRGLQAGCEFAEAFLEIPLPIQGPFYNSPASRKSVF